MVGENSVETFAGMNSMAEDDVEKDHRWWKKTAFMCCTITRSLEMEAKNIFVH